MSERDVFTAAREMTDPAARSAYLDGACGGDPGLRSRVEALLRAHGQPDSLLDHPAVAAHDPDHGATEALTGTPDPGVAASQTTGGENGASDDEALTFLATPTRPDALGRLGHYEVLQVLGRGGFGIVFRAFDEVLQRVVALKVMAPQLAATSPARKRFLREARSSAQVRHENVVQVYEVAEQPLPYLAMEYIPGETLQQRLDRTGPLDVPEVLRVGRQIAEGLAAAHATDLIHRDIKPGNVLLEGGQQRVKITDFGLARAADDASISQSGLIAGTPMYMAPEQAKGEKLDQRADLFSLGSVLYQMVTGRPPFRANSTVAVLKRVAEDTPRDIREIIPETPQWLCAIIAKLHAKDPADRYQSAQEVADVLADCEAQLKANAKLKDYSRIPRGKSAPSGKRKWVAAAVLLLPLIALAATELAGVTHLFRKEQMTQNPVEPSSDPTPQTDDGWAQLFNGKDLTGWKTHPDQPGNWRVEDGVLIGSDKVSHLFTERGDYANFHLRVEAMINPKGDSGVFFRSAFGFNPDSPYKIMPRGYEVQIVDRPFDMNTGTLFWRTPLMKVTESPTEADKWFTLEVVADGRRLATRVNGKPTAYLVDEQEGRPTKGHIALQVFHSFTVVKFRKIEIKELPANPPGAAPPLADPAEVPRTAADVLPFLAGNWKMERQTGDPKAPSDKAKFVGHVTYDFVAGGKCLRGRGDMGEGRADFVFLFTFDPGTGGLHWWQAWSSGLTAGPFHCQFIADTRTLILSDRIGDIDAVGQFRFVDANTFTHRYFYKDASGTISRESNATFTRIPGVVALRSLSTDPKRPAEMKVLDRIVGEWRNEMTVSVAGPDTKVQTVRVKAEPILGGRFIEKFETNEATGDSDYTLNWFDTDAKKYRLWFFNHSGSVTEFTVTWDGAAKTLTWNSVDGRLEGRLTFKSGDLYEFQRIVKDKDGKVLSETASVSRRIWKEVEKK